MRLLQFCNVANVVGGTGACGWTITKCFPDWHHGVYFKSGRRLSTETALAFDGASLYLNSMTSDQAIEDFKPDVILFHNTSHVIWPQSIPAGSLTIFYQHSNLREFKASAEKCDVAFCVSNHLAEETGFDKRFVLYQPVPAPPNGLYIQRERGLVGRICTPHSGKWEREDVLPVYRILAEKQPGLRYEFVGAPDSIREDLWGILGESAEFFPASWQARERFHKWDMMVYSSSVTETYGRTVCEAQRAGCVPIVSRRGGFIEQVSEGVTGFLCDSPEGFAASVGAVRNAVDRSAMIDAAIERGSLAGFRQKFLKTLEVLVN